MKRRSSLVHPCRINRNAKDAFPGSHQCRFYAPALRVVEPRRADNFYDVDHASANPTRGRTSPGRATPSMRPSSWFRDYGSVARAVALHCKSAAPGAASVRKEPYSRTLPGNRPLSFRRAGRSRTRAGRPRPALHPDGTTACPRPGALRRRLAKGSALSTTHRSLAAACSAARRRAAMAGSCCPSARLLRRGAARRRARAHSVDGWTTVATLSAAFGAAGLRAARARSPGPGRAIGRAARKKRDAYWCAGAAAR